MRSLRTLSLHFLFFSSVMLVPAVQAQEILDEPINSQEAVLSEQNIVPEEMQDLKEPIFDDKLLLEGYTEKYLQQPKDILLAMIQDETLSSFRMAAAVRAFKEKYSLEVFSREKRVVEKILLRRLARTDSAFVQVEILHTICRMDRFKYFDTMMPGLIQKLNHYNSNVNVLAFDGINDIIDRGNNRAREARIVFNTIRRMMFLSRRRLATVLVPDTRLKQKLQILRWSVKVLGSQELKKLPKEVLNLL